MPAPWAENQFKVVIEFLKGSQGARRVINLKHSGSVVPQQLQGRVGPAEWAAFMQDVQQLASTHPYVVNPSAGRMCGWLGGAVMGAVVGFCCINPDGGDYGVWLPQVDQVIARHQAAFNAGGCRLSLQRAQMSHWIQVDVDPSMAVGQPVPAAGYSAPAPVPYPPASQPYSQPPPQQPYPVGQQAPQPYPGAPVEQPYGPGGAASKV